MRQSNCLSRIFLISSALAVVAVSPANATGEDILHVPRDGTILVNWGGRNVPFEMHGDGSSAPILSGSAAKELGLQGSFISIKVKVGKSALVGETAVARYAVAGRNMKRRVVWFPQRVSKYAGVLGPGSVPHPTVEFELGAPRPNEREYTLPMAVNGREGIAVKIGEVFVQFDPLLATSYVTASGGVAISSAHGGHFDGLTIEREIRFGIRRPVRRVQLADPFPIGPLRLNAFDVRTADYGTAEGIPDPLADPDEILVVGKGKQAASRNWLHVGREALSKCSFLVFDTRARLVRLRCQA